MKRNGGPGKARGFYLLVAASLRAGLIPLSGFPTACRAQAGAPITPSGLNRQLNLAPTAPPGSETRTVTKERMRLLAGFIYERREIGVEEFRLER
jgi:hypothetical protein